MFWDSVVAGLRVLTYWETYVAALEYLAIFFIPTALIAVLVTDDSVVKTHFGFWFGLVVFPVLQAAATIIYVLTLAPIMLGFSDEAAWRLPWAIAAAAPGSFLALVGVLIAVSIGLSLIPVLGRSGTLNTLAVGGVVLTYLLRNLGQIYPGIISRVTSFIPGFWFTVGLLVVSGGLSLVGTMAIGLVVVGTGMEEKGIDQLVFHPVAAVFGFIPVFIYGAWLGGQILGRY